VPSPTSVAASPSSVPPSPSAPVSTIAPAAQSMESTASSDSSADDHQDGRAGETSPSSPRPSSLVQPAAAPSVAEPQQQQQQLDEAMEITGTSSRGIRENKRRENKDQCHKSQKKIL